MGSWQSSNRDTHYNSVMVQEEEEEKSLGEQEKTLGEEEKTLEESWEYLGDPVANEQAHQVLEFFVSINDDEEENNPEGFLNKKN